MCRKKYIADKKLQHRQKKEVTVGSKKTGRLHRFSAIGPE
jgi:hypothetical protein